MSGPSHQSKLTQEVTEFACLALVAAAWALVTLFPEGGLASAPEVVLRGTVAAIACVLLALVMSWPLQARGLIRCTPLRGRLLKRRERQAIDGLAELARQRQTLAADRAIGSRYIPSSDDDIPPRTDVRFPVASPPR